MPKRRWNSSIRPELTAVFAACAMLAGCGDSDNEPGPGGVSVGEARALDRAAEMLDQQRLPAEALAEPGAGPENGPEDGPVPAGETSTPDR